MKKFLFVLVTLITVGVASAAPVTQPGTNSGNTVSGSRSMWAG